MTRSDGARNETDDGRARTEPERSDGADSEREAGRFEKYFEYVLDLLSFL